jgi:phage replication-related protein YjqB (UPF0714/DUF867 family)
MTSINRSFKDLAKKHVEGRDYQIRIASKRSRVLVMAPHGGKIEPGTSEIAEAIADSDYSLYCFEGLKSHAKKLFHVESHRFDEPSASQAVAKSEVIIAIHGQNNRKNAFIMIGGLNSDLRLCVEAALKAADFETRAATKTTRGSDPHNICNRGKLKAAVQLEISRRLRESLKNDDDQLHLFASSIRKAIQMYLKSNNIMKSRNPKGSNRWKILHKTIP